MQSNLGKMPYEVVSLSCKTCEPLGTNYLLYSVLMYCQPLYTTTEQRCFLGFNLVMYWSIKWFW